MTFTLPAFTSGVIASKFAGLSAFINAVYAANDPPPGSGSAMRFTRVANSTGIVVAAANGASVPAYRKFHAANPSVPVFNGLVYLYYRCDPGTNIQSLGCMTQPVAGFDPLNGTWTDRGVVLSPGTGYDGIWDPCVFVDAAGKMRVMFNTQTAYGSAPIGEVWTAESTDGFNFTNITDCGFVQQAGGACAVGATNYHFGGGASGNALVFRTSANGKVWSSPSPVVLSKSSATYSTTGTPYGDPDGAGLLNPRFFIQLPYLFMTYAATPLGYTLNGTSNFPDWPETCILARTVLPLTSSSTFEKCGHPIAMRGPVGAFDAAANWSPSYLRLNSTSWLFTENVGGSALASRDTPYSGFPTESSSGGSGGTCFSQIGVAVAPADATLANWYPDVTDLPTGVYTFQNPQSGRYMGAAGTATSSAVNQYAAAQSWYLVRGPDSFYSMSLVAAGPDRAQSLGVNNASNFRTAGAALQIFPASATPSVPITPQEYLFVPVSHTGPGNGKYEIVNRYSGFNLEVSGGSTAEGATLDFAARNGSGAQQWNVVQVASQLPVGVTLSGSAASGQVALTMSAFANGSPITSFTVQRSTAAAGPFTTVGTATPATSPTGGTTTATYVDSGVSNGSTYYEQVIVNTAAGSTTSAVAGPFSPAAAAPAHYLASDASHNATATPLTAATITDGYIDIVSQIAPNSYTASGSNTLVGKWPAASQTQNNSSFVHQITANGNPFFAWTAPSGPISTTTSSAAVPANVQSNAAGGFIRVQCNVGSAAVTPLSGSAVTSIAAGTCVFSTSLDGTTWTQLGTTQTGIRTDGISQQSVTGLVVGTGTASSGNNPFVGKIYKVTIRNSAGTILANPDFTAQATGTTSFTDSASLTWAETSGAQI